METQIIVKCKVDDLEKIANLLLANDFDVSLKQEITVRPTVQNQIINFLKNTEEIGMTEFKRNLAHAGIPYNVTGQVLDQLAIEGVIILSV